jgi:DUF971 family protein
MIKDIIQTLNVAHRQELMLAFDKECSHMIPLEDGTFIGVHTPSKGVQVIERQGQWVHGKMNVNAKG